MKNNSTLLPRSVPEREGIRSADLEGFFRTLDESPLEFHHVTVVKNGKVIGQASWEPYRPEYPHMTHSLTKLFTKMKCTAILSKLPCFYGGKEGFCMPGHISVRAV
ncbi:MAG: hypothetical protein IKO22_07195 [Oscillospiraceae bacterium]|nr:hypothetical protein [Oscillospiraceae bacterium]